MKARWSDWGEQGLAGLGIDLAKPFSVSVEPLHMS